MQQAYSKERAATGGGPITQTYKELLVCATSVKWPQTVDSFVVSCLHATLALLLAVLVARGVVNSELNSPTSQFRSLSQIQLFDLRSIRYLIQTSDRGISPSDR